MTHGEARQLAREIKKDQEEWLHKTFMRLLPGKFRDMINRRQVSASQILRWARENGFQVTFLPSTIAIEIRAKNQLVDRYQWQPNTNDDQRGGEMRPVDIFKVKHPEAFPGNDIWVEGS
jgi:hypothetical protein